MKFNPELLARAAHIKLAIFDVDGVLTDGGLYFGEQGECMKRFNTLDGHGIKMLQASGCTVAVITGRDSPALRNRLNALGVTQAVYGTEDKLPAAERMLQELNLDWSACAVMGDDWPDLPMMQQAQLACAPANAHVENQSRAHYVTQRAGGHGAVREVCDLIMQAGGQYAARLGAYIST